MNQNLVVAWEKLGGLLPVIVQEEATNEILMLAYMNEEALKLSMQTGYAHYYSRSKNRIWKKGESSQNTQEIISAFLDCDNDSLLIKVKQNGGKACHTGSKTCFFNKIKNYRIIKEQNNKDIAQKNIYNILDEIYHVILDRKLSYNAEKSYVSSLFKKGQEAILKKVIEEAGEFIMACKEGDFLRRCPNPKININQKTPQEMIVYEMADLLFHSIIALADFDIHPEQILSELARRQGISGLTEKANRDNQTKKVTQNNNG